MQRVNASRMDTLVSTKNVIELVQAQITQQIGSIGRRYPGPLPSAVSDELTRRFLTATPSPGGVLTQLADAPLDQAVQQALQLLKNLNRGSTAPSPGPPQLSELRCHVDMNFDDAVPVGGWMDISIFPNGEYNFAGHFHDSGAASY